MSRRIQTGPPEEPLILGVESRSVTYATTSTPQVEADGYLDRLVKYIPAEIIALYLGVSNVIPKEDSSYLRALWIVTCLTAICTPIYMYYATHQAGQPTLWPQIVISSVAFPIWVFAIGGPFQSYSWYEHKRWIAAVVISFATFMAGMYQPKTSSQT